MATEQLLSNSVDCLSAPNSPTQVTLPLLAGSSITVANTSASSVSSQQSRPEPPNSTSATLKLAAAAAEYYNDLNLFTAKKDSSSQNDPLIGSSSSQLASTCLPTNLTHHQYSRNTLPTSCHSRDSPFFFSDISSCSSTSQRSVPVNVDHRRYPSSSASQDESNSLSRFPLTNTSSNNNMVAIDFSMLARNSSANSTGNGYKFSSLTSPSMSFAGTSTLQSTGSSRRSHEEDIYEDLCYVTLRSSREKTLGTLLLEPIEKRDYCIKELVETEKNYCEALRMIINHFYQPLSKILHLEDRLLIFNNLKSLTDLHGKFYNELYRACSGSTCVSNASSSTSNNISMPTSTSNQSLSSNLIQSCAASMPLLPVIGNASSQNSVQNSIFSTLVSSNGPSGSFTNLNNQNNTLYYGSNLQNAPSLCSSTSSYHRLSSCFLNFKDRFLIYGEYCANLPKAQALLDELCARDEMVSQCVTQCQNKANDGKFKLRDLLSLPMQRILKYHLLLGELIKTTAETHDDYSGLKQAHDVMLDIGGYINEVKRDTETLEIIRDVQRSIVDLSMPENYELKDYGRLIKDGEVRIRSQDDLKMRLKNRYVFIFDKVVLMCKALRGLQYSYKEAIVLEEYKIEELSSASPISKLTKNWSNGWSLVHVRTKQTFMFYVKNEDAKRKWLEAIERAQDTVRPKELQRTDHRFSIATVPIATYCTACAKLLRGTWYQGYLCGVCNIAVHKSCITSVNSCGSCSDSVLCGPIKRESAYDSDTFQRNNCRLNLSSTTNRHSPSSHLICAPPTPSRSKRIIAKAIGSHFPHEKGELAFEAEDTIIVYNKHPNSIWHGRNIRTGEEGTFSASLVTELAADSPASSSIESPTVNSSTLRFSYEDPFGPVGDMFHMAATLPRKFPSCSNSNSSNHNTPSPQASLLLPSSPLAASTPAVNQITSTSGNYFFSNTSLLHTTAATTSTPNTTAIDEANIRLYYGNGFNLEEYAWFAGSMDRETAQTTLGPLPNGSFLVRISPKQKNNYAISINYNGQVKHMRVCVTQAAGITATIVQSGANDALVGQSKQHFYLSETRYFRTIVDLVRWYELHSLSESFNMVNTQLLLPYKKAYCSEILGHAVALYAFTGTSSAASSFLSLRKGDSVTVLSRAAEDKGWWKGQLGDRIGYFPFKYVTPTTPSLKIFHDLTSSAPATSANQTAPTSELSKRENKSSIVVHSGPILHPDTISLISSNMTETSNLSPTSPLCPNRSLLSSGSPNVSFSALTTCTTTTEISQKPSPSISPSSFSSSTSSNSSSTSPTTLSSPVNSDTQSMHSRQTSSDAGIEAASTFIHPSSHSATSTNIHHHQQSNGSASLQNCFGSMSLNQHNHAFHSAH